LKRVDINPPEPLMPYARARTLSHRVPHFFPVRMNEL
jgi:hypothetical protein